MTTTEPTVQPDGMDRPSAGKPRTERTGHAPFICCRTHGDGAAHPTPLDVERLNLAAYRTPEQRGETRKAWLIRVAAEYARLSESEQPQEPPA